ncbi:hypothetical protein EYE42_15460 [Paracoccus subflavus]|uniref:DUF2497 domain-containing protein n=1 Tax=Paracoccus subflavus TaxID=2528244 RepID=A0A4Q9FWM3_9RHOB|nr:hypothetical protein [Paracoccus subflavus]TBN36562.1 hypothetical protein EYE42_15460 [Paracoccus subflavus]
MADPQMSQNAARLSEDIGDVLSAIRRMIADDDALSHARDRVRSERTSGLAEVIPDDAGEFLARRHGGNAALARQMVETNARPTPAPVIADPEIRPAIPHFILRPGPKVAAPAPAAPVPAAEIAPLRVSAERRVDDTAAQKPSGWRAWLRPEPVEPQAVAAKPADAFEKTMASPAEEDSDDFAEAFDWKARMRPELDEPVQAVGTACGTADQRLSGWASPLDASSDPVARLAAEAAAFDAEMLAQADARDEEQSIRDLLRDMVQDELNGELGERFSANLRAVIRREVAAAIDTYLDRF